MLVTILRGGAVGRFRGPVLGHHRRTGPPPASPEAVLGRTGGCWAGWADWAGLSSIGDVQVETRPGHYATAAWTGWCRHLRFVRKRCRPRTPPVRPLRRRFDDSNIPSTIVRAADCLSALLAPSDRRPLAPIVAPLATFSHLCLWISCGRLRRAGPHPQPPKAPSRPPFSEGCGRRAVRPQLEEAPAP